MLASIILQDTIIDNLKIKIYLKHLSSTTQQIFIRVKADFTKSKSTKLLSFYLFLLNKHSWQFKSTVYFRVRFRLLLYNTVYIQEYKFLKKTNK